MRPVKVMIVDGHEVVRLGLRSVFHLEDDIEVVGDYENALDALRAAKTEQPDVTLMDVRMPGMDGIEACRQMREMFSDARVVMLTSFSDEEAVAASIMAGASGYLLKNTGIDEMLRIVRSAARGDSLLDSELIQRVLGKMSRLTLSGSDPSAGELTERQVEVLALIAEGLTNREIANRLVISVSTARNHVSNILLKLGLTRRSQAATFAVQVGLTDDKT